MPIKMSWLLESRVIFSVYSGEITVEDIEGFNITMRQYLDTGTAPLVHIISDATQIGKFPLSLGVLNKILFQERPHPKMGWIIVVTSNRSLSFISGMLAQLGRARFRTMKTMEEATAFLNEVDSTLPILVVQPTVTPETHVNGE